MQYAGKLEILINDSTVWNFFGTKGHFLRLFFWDRSSIT